MKVVCDHLIDIVIGFITLVYLGLIIFLLGGLLDLFTGVDIFVGGLAGICLLALCWSIGEHVRKLIKRRI